MGNRRPRRSAKRCRNGPFRDRNLADCGRGSATNFRRRSRRSISPPDESVHWPTGLAFRAFPLIKLLDAHENFRFRSIHRKKVRTRLAANPKLNSGMSRPPNLVRDCSSDFVTPSPATNLNTPLVPERLPNWSTLFQSNPAMPCFCQPADSTPSGTAICWSKSNRTATPPIACSIGTRIDETDRSGPTGFMSIKRCNQSISTTSRRVWLSPTANSSSGINYLKFKNGIWIPPARSRRKVSLQLSAV